MESYGVISERRLNHYFQEQKMKSFTNILKFQSPSFHSHFPRLKYPDETGLGLHHHQFRVPTTPGHAGGRRGSSERISENLSDNFLFFTEDSFKIGSVTFMTCTLILIL